MGKYMIFMCVYLRAKYDFKVILIPTFPRKRNMDSMRFLGVLIFHGFCPNISHAFVQVIHDMEYERYGVIHNVMCVCVLMKKMYDKLR